MCACVCVCVHHDNAMLQLNCGCGSMSYTARVKGFIACFLIGIGFTIVVSILCFTTMIRMIDFWSDIANLLQNSMQVQALSSIFQNINHCSELQNARCPFVHMLVDRPRK